MSAAWWKAKAWTSRWTRIRIADFTASLYKVRNAPTNANNVAIRTWCQKRIAEWYGDGRITLKVVLLNFSDIVCKYNLSRFPSAKVCFSPSCLSTDHSFNSAQNRDL